MEDSEKPPVEAAPSQNASIKEKLESELQIPKANIPIEVKSFPRVTDSEFRLACHDIAEVLADHWKFKFQVIGAMILLFLVFAVAGFGLLGWTIKDTANDEIKQEKEDLDKEIKEQFKTENIRVVVKQVASENAADLIKNSIQPSIESSQKTLADFNQHLKDQQASADTELAAFRNELTKLEKRNEITGLADQAIEEGDVSAYRKLLEITQSPSHTAGAEAELFRVLEAYSIFAPIRWVGSTLKPELINPLKTKEEELDTADLLHVIDIASSEPAARGRAADLLAKVAKPGSYSTAKSIMEDIQKENNLEVIKRLKSALSHTAASYKDGGTIDGQDALDWWKAHELEVQKTDTDKK